MTRNAQEPLQLDLFAETVELRRLEPDRNMARFYLMVLQPDLFGGVDLVREWGRIGSPGRVCVSHHPDRGQAVDALADHARAKRRRYVLCVG